MKYLLVLGFFSSSLLASEFLAGSLTYTEETAVKMLNDLNSKTKQKCAGEIVSTSTQNGSGSALKNNLDGTEKCVLHLGWGHVGHSKNYIKKVQGTGIGMGCNSGEAGVGSLEHKNEWWRFQRGSNGAYANDESQGTQNGGLNPVIFEGEDKFKDDKGSSVFLKNSFVGFMRLSQFHWLKLHQYAQDELLKNSCSQVKIKFDCVDGDNKKFEASDSWKDLDGDELNRRLTAWEKEVSFKDPIYNKKYQTELEILNRFKPLENCFTDETKKSLPSGCDSEVVITSKDTIKEHCLDWMKKIDQTPQHNWETDESLPRPKKYNYPAKGDLN